METPPVVRCHYCQVGRYLEEEAPRHQEKAASEILALARAWHRRCVKCDCGCYVPRNVLQKLRMVLARQ
jgi:biotin synthase-like enzyme